MYIYYVRYYRFIFENVPPIIRMRIEVVTDKIPQTSLFPTVGVFIFFSPKTLLRHYYYYYRCRRRRVSSDDVDKSRGRNVKQHD